MISKWRWLVGQITQLLWLRAGLFALIGVVTALAGVAAESYLPLDTPEVVGADAVGTVLNVLASSMLAVTTFSLGVMVSAYGNASSNVTPRATKLLMQDTTSQNVLSTFIGSFLFGLVGIVTLTIEGYGSRGRLVLFLVTIGVIVVVVMALLRWIDYLSRLGSVGETTKRIEAVARDAIGRRIEQPCLGGRRLDDTVRVPDNALSVPPDKTGYVQHIDTAALESWAEEHSAEIFLGVVPGSFVVAGGALARVRITANDPEEVADAVRRSFTVGEERTFEQDPRFGVVVLAEVASRALSPGVNDSGTAIDVIGRMVRVLSDWAREDKPDEEDIKCPHVFVPPIDDRDLFEDAFMMIGRDGAHLIEVQLRLQKALAHLSERGDSAFREAALRESARALATARREVYADEDMARIEAAAPRASLG